jgi:hypothetical protein
MCRYGGAAADPGNSGVLGPPRYLLTFETTVHLLQPQGNRRSAPPQSSISIVSTTPKLPPDHSYPLYPATIVQSVC